MKNAACVTIFISLFIATITSTVLAQDQTETQTINVIGSGRIHGEDISSARDQAISDCLVTAISLVAADMLQQQVFIQSFQDINRILFSGADKYVQDYKVLTEDTTGRIYRVMVQTTVSVEKIRELLIRNDILSQNATPLKVLLLIAEKDLEDPFYRYWWGDTPAGTISEAPLAGALVEQGFVVVDHNPSQSVTGDFDNLTEISLSPEMSNEQAADFLGRESTALGQSRSLPDTGNTDTLTETTLGPEMSNDQAAHPAGQAPAGLDHSRSQPGTGNADTLTETMPGPEMSNDQAAAIGARYQADVVVVGTATVKKASNVLGDELRSFEGTLSVRAIRTDTGLVLAEVNHNFITADADNMAGSHRALMEASTQTGALLAGKVQTAWLQTSEKGPTAATIAVEGNFQLSHLVAFRRILSAMSGVSNLQTTEMTPQKTVLSLDYNGTAKKLAEALLLNSFEGFGVHISEVTAGTIHLSLVSN